MQAFWALASDRWWQLAAISAALLLICLLGLLDYWTGYELSFFIFYVFPVAIASWFVGRHFGFVASFVSLVVWFFADRASGHQYSEEWIPLWNGFVRLSFFITFTYMISELKARFDFEKRSARIDGLTGALNGRAFREKIGTLIPLAARTKSAFALCFIDLDNFKKVNDTRGHAMGDEILRRTVNTMKKAVRNTDVVGRMGGDEFAIFLPATDARGAEQVLQELRTALLDEVKREGWPIGFSMGAVTADPPPDGEEQVSVDDAIHQADTLMYQIKTGGKNDIIIQPFVLPGAPFSADADTSAMVAAEPVIKDETAKTARA